MLPQTNNVALGANVYSIKKDKKGEYYLVPTLMFYKVPEKLYGETNEIVERVWSKYVSSDESIGVMLTGTQGSGKTVIANLLSNTALTYGLPVIEVINIDVNVKLVEMLYSLPDCVLLLDEFGKNFNMNVQSKSLTMFSSKDHGKKLFIITENSKDMVSPFIRNRPGRVRYHYDFDRISKRTIKEYCSDYDVDPVFYKDLINLYNKSGMFTIDFLITLVDEHLTHPEDSLEELLKILNLSVLVKPIMLQVEEVEKIDKDGNPVMKMIINRPGSPIEKEYFFNRDYRFYLTVSEPPKEKTKEELEEEEKRRKEMQKNGMFMPPINNHMPVDEDRIDVSNKDVIEYSDEYITAKVNSNGSNKEYIVKIKIIQQ